MGTEESFKPPSLPPYREMILEAIIGLNARNGSNKTLIVRFIESKYGDLPFALSLLISHHLKRMKEMGELVFWKNNYMMPGPNVPPRGRGRGRPPKPKPESSSSEELNPLSGSGCPPKDPNDSLVPQTQDSMTVGSGRPRGRPPKMTKPTGGLATTAETTRTGMPLKPKLEPLSSEESNPSSNTSRCPPNDAYAPSEQRKQDYITIGSQRPRAKPPKMAKLVEGVTGDSATAADTTRTGIPPKVKSEPLSSEELNTSSTNVCSPTPRKQDSLTIGSRRPRGDHHPR